MFRIGSLFSGSGGFELAATMCGGTPLWASEVEPFPIAVTRSRFPNMKHLGSVTDINGGEVEPVDIISFGSPCQDLSVAGKRAGLKHEDNGDDETTRSGLFMEAIRIIKEMRSATNGLYPRFAIWENVPGAFSSNSGQDFRTVLQELIQIVEPSAVMPAVPKNGWPYADSYCGEGWSLAYRVFDAQYWGVPQRRRRIYLVLDLRGECAGEVLFKREGLRGYFAEGRTPWQGIAPDAEDSIGADDRTRKITSRADSGGEVPDAENLCRAGSDGSRGDDRSVSAGYGGGRGRNCVAVPYTLKIRSGCEGGGKGALVQTDLSATLATNNDQYLFVPVVDSHILDDQGGQQISVRTDGKSPTLRAEMHGNVPCVMEAAGFKELNSAKARSDGYGYEVAPCLTADKHDACAVYSIENHPADSRVDIDDSGKVQTLTSRMGTSGGNVPMVMEPVVFRKGTRPHSADEAQKWEYANVANTLNTFDQGEARANELVVEPVYCLQGNGIDRADTAGCNGKGVKEDVCCTLNTIDRPAVAFQTYQKVTGPLMANTHPGSYTGQDAFSDMLIAGKEETPVVLDRAFFNQGQNAQYDPQFYTDGTVPTLVARGPSAVAHRQEVRWIVRCLTPTECARLQGFADRWAVPIQKDDFTNEEYAFWCKVYLTKLMIDGKVENDENGDLVYTTSRKPFKHKTKEQMLKWYNGLRTDSSEYKLWGNGIALPNALYVMQGIADVLNQ